MTRDEFAAKINGREYREELNRDEVTEAKASRLLVVYGASDDLTEFSGIVDDEVGAWNGHTSFVRLVGFTDRWVVDSAGIPIKAEWCPEGFIGSWRISTPIPHATFNVMEDGELYCQGIVVSESDMLAALTGEPVPSHSLPVQGGDDAKAR